MGFLDKLLGREKKDEPAAAAPEEQPHGATEDDASDLTHAEQDLSGIRDQGLRDQGRM